MPYKLEDIPFHQIEKLGVTRHLLEQTGNLERLLNGERTNVIPNMKTVQGGVEKRFSAILKLERNPDGKLQFKIEAPPLQESIRLATPEDILLENIPFQQIERFGITQESLRQSGDLEKLLRGEKTNIIHNIVFSISGVEKKASARLFLIVTRQQSLKFQMDFVLPPQAPSAS